MPFSLGPDNKQVLRANNFEISIYSNFQPTKRGRGILANSNYFCKECHLMEKHSTSAENATISFLRAVF